MLGSAGIQHRSGDAPASTADPNLRLYIPSHDTLPPAFSSPLIHRSRPAPGVLDKLLYGRIGGAYESAPRRWICLTMTDTTLTPGDHESRQGGRRAAYDYQWRAFASWCIERDGDIPLPVPASTVAEYLSHRVAVGASHSTLRVIAAAIARQHADLELANPCEDPIVESVLAESERSAPPAAPRSRPLDLEAYRAIRKTAQRPRPGRGGWDEALLSARDRGRMDVAMIGLMRDGPAPSEGGGDPEVERDRANERRYRTSPAGRGRCRSVPGH